MTTQQHHQQPAEEEEQVAELWSFPTNPAEFDADERISFSKLDNKFIAVQEDGSEYEFDTVLKRWIPTIDEALIEEYQAAYAPPHIVVESSSNNSTSNSSSRKRKPHDDAPGSGSGGGGRRPPKRQAAAGEREPPAQKQNTAIYVTGLPLDATMEEVAELFSRKCGVIAEEIDGNRPRIKMYTDPATGGFKGDALIVFFKPQSVDMAIVLLDDTDFRFTASGTSAGRIRVQAADASYKKMNYGGGQEDGGENGKSSSNSNGNGNGSSRAPAPSSAAVGGGGVGAAAAGGDPTARPPPPAPAAAQRSAADKQKIIKKTQKLHAKLADWDDDDPYPHLAASLPPVPSSADEQQQSGRSGGGGAGGGGTKDRIVILRHMFTLEELAEDPAALLDIKEDVRDECEKLGEVTNVVLYDLEPEGVVSVKFRRAEGARECIALMDGRSFGGRVVEARLSSGREKFRRSRDRDDDGEEG